MTRNRTGLVLLLVITLYWGCADQIVSQCESETQPTIINATYSSIESNLFRPTCGKGGCHSGTNPAANLTMSGGLAYDQLVDVTSSQENTLKRVKPGDSDNSFIIWKLEARGTSVMPPSGALSAATIDSIRKWIDDGAVKN